ncbi:MAG TPA: hypothetical protein VGN42_27230, partial [Pirellulales bacterium]|nr:hypothetical protein [Pirellulales bacterium]
ARRHGLIATATHKKHNPATEHVPSSKFVFLETEKTPARGTEIEGHPAFLRSLLTSLEKAYHGK